MDYITFPSFSIENLSIWFTQMESAFALNGIIEESDKYDYILTYVPSESLRIVEDIILNPPTNDKYEHIKHEFIKRMVIKKLMGVEFGNETPSAYLRKLKNIAGQRVSNEEILNLWLNNLPEEVRYMVRLANSGNMDRLCEIADKTIVLMTPTPISTTSNQLELKEGKSHKPWCEMMKRCMKTLSNQILKNIGQHECDKDDEQQSSSQENLPNVQKEILNTSSWNSMGCSFSKKICWYHTNFGDKAIACVAPCQYKFCPTSYNVRK